MQRVLLVFTSGEADARTEGARAFQAAEPGARESEADDVGDVCDDVRHVLDDVGDVCDDVEDVPKRTEGARDYGGDVGDVFDDVRHVWDDGGGEAAVVPGVAEGGGGGVAESGVENVDVGAEVGEPGGGGLEVEVERSQGGGSASIFGRMLERAEEREREGARARKREREREMEERQALVLIEFEHAKNLAKDPCKNLAAAAASAGEVVGASLPADAEVSAGEAAGGKGGRGAGAGSSSSVFGQMVDASVERVHGVEKELASVRVLGPPGHVQHARHTF